MRYGGVWVAIKAMEVKEEVPLGRVLVVRVAKGIIEVKVALGWRGGGSSR